MMSQYHKSFVITTPHQDTLSANTMQPNHQTGI